MKKAAFVFIFILSTMRLGVQSWITWYNMEYIPNHTTGTAAVLAGPGYGVRDYYVNLQKYWFYRYRLVNDFMMVGDGPGESIPITSRIYDCGGGHSLGFTDATISLGRYIAVLATEYELLRNNGLSTTRTLFELTKALNAFDRLDDLAEEYSHDMDHGIGTFPGYPGQLPSTLSIGHSLNGFFIRDDVPFATWFDPAWSGHDYSTTFTNFEFFQKHFNRQGLRNTVDTRDTIYEDLTGSTRNYGIVGSAFGNRYQGPNPMHLGDSRFDISNSIAGRAPRWPQQESQDQLADIDMGLSLVAHYTSPGSSLNNQAKSANLQIYPNPSTDILSISQPELKIGTSVTIKVLNSIGQVVLSERTTWSQPTEQISLAGFAAGTYLIVVDNGNGDVRKQQVVKL